MMASDASPPPSGEPDSVVLLTIVPDLAAALSLRSALEASGIPTFLPDEGMLSVAWQYTNLLGGARVQVPRSRLAEARALLDALGGAGSDEDVGSSKDSFAEEAEAAARERDEMLRVGATTEGKSTPPPSDADHRARGAFREVLVLALFPPLMVVATPSVLRAWLTGGRRSFGGWLRLLVATSLLVLWFVSFGYLFARILARGGSLH